MSYLTYKILVHPKTFETFVQELTVPENDDEMPLGKRQMTNEEVEAKWVQDEFIEALSEYGYGYAAQRHIEKCGLFKSQKQ